MTAMPKVSVVLPVFNAGDYLRSALNSILRQTYSDFELIAINDGSTDGSLQLLQEIAAQDSRVRVISRTNKGLVATLNEGVALAEGEFIARMDSDDIALPTRFAKQIDYLESHPECVAVGSRVLLIDGDGLPICEFAKAVEHEDIDSAHMAGEGGAIPHPSVIIRKAALQRIGGYREEYLYAEDLDIFLRLAEIGRVANLPEVLLEYRQHPTSIGYSRRATQKRSAYAAVMDSYRRRGLNSAEIGEKFQNDVFLDPTLAAVYVKWGWWALGGGNLRTARKYAFRAFKKEPFRRGLINLLFCVVRGH